jgi:ParB/RepB/Spo0J family partition protein
MNKPNTENIGDIVTLTVSLIDPDPKNRKDHNADDLRSLAESIKTDDLLQPILVRLHPTKAGRYMIEAGERRWRAHVLNKATAIKARVVKTETELGAARKRAVENFQRVDLNAIDEARMFRELVVDHKLSQAEVAKIAGKQNPSYVSNSLRLLECPAKVQEMIMAGELTRAHGVALAKWGRWGKACETIARLAANHGWSSKGLENSPVPFSGTLADAGLVIGIRMLAQWPTEGYTLSAEQKKDPAFIGTGNTVYCFEPEKWTKSPEKAAQDKARSQKIAKSEKREEGKQSGMTPKEKAERQRVITENKQARTESALGHVAVLQRIKDVKDFDAACVVVLACVATAAHWKYGSSERVKSVAGMLGIALPKGFELSDMEGIVKLKPVDAMRLATGCLLDRESEEAAKYSSPIGAEIEHVLGAKLTKALREKAAQAIASADAKKGGKAK